MTPVRFGIVGTGWRSEFFLRIGSTLPDRLQLVGQATRDPDKGTAIEARWQIPTVRTADELVERFQPDFVVASVAWAATPTVIRSVADRGVPVLAETPPAPGRQELRQLWLSLADPSRVQIAEQYPYLPKMQAYRSMIGTGLLGDVTSVQVSWTQLYHAVALLRSFLGAGFDCPTVLARSFRTPITASLGRGGWPSEEQGTTVKQTMAMLDFSGRLGVYDFTDEQWFHPLLGRRLNVRGTHGEIVDDHLTRLLDPRTPVREQLARRQTGIDGDLEGFDLDTLTLGGRVWYRNPFQGRRFSDEDIAIATMLVRTADWVRGEAEAPYPLAEACQDHLIALAINEAAERGRPVEVSREPWAA